MSTDPLQESTWSEVIEALKRQREKLQATIAWQQRELAALRKRIEELEEETRESNQAAIDARHVVVEVLLYHTLLLCGETKRCGCASCRRVMRGLQQAQWAFPATAIWWEDDR